MTEEEWLQCEDANELFRTLVNRRKNRLSCRKFRFIGCAACRAMWAEMTASHARDAILLIEQYADGLAPEEDVRVADDNFHRHVASLATQAANWCTWGPWRGRGSLSGAVACAVGYTKMVLGPNAVTLPHLVRCVAGNPFRPMTLDPAWLTSDVAALARGIYDDRAFDRLPILADALQDAGCDNADVLTHCRSDGPHARGCWVVDLVLGKA